jgi:subtilisin family serine protease
MRIALLRCGLLVGLMLPQVGAGQNGPPLDPHNPKIVPGVVLVRFDDSVTIPVTANGPVGKLTGMAGLPDLARDYGVVECQRLFPLADQPGIARKIVARDGSEHGVGSLHNVFRMKLKEGYDPRVVARQLTRQSGVAYAEPDYVVACSDAVTSAAEGRPSGSSLGGPAKVTETVTSDPLVSEQWYLGPYPGVSATAAWEMTTGDSAQVIAIIDTGVDWDHPDLDANIWTNRNEYPDNGIDDDGNGFIDDVRGWDLVNSDNDPNDDNGHGTHVAGIAAGEGDNGTGIVGVAWQARIMPLKVLQSSGRGSVSDVALAVDYARRNGATVINMSLGTYGESLVLKAALENAYATAVLVAAAGNDAFSIDPIRPPSAPFYPACYGFVIGVQACDRAGELAPFTNFDPSGPVAVANSYGHNYELSAPGVGICSTFPNGGYRTLNGTSMAAPIVSGAVALIKAYGPLHPNDWVFAQLVQGSRNGVLDIAGSIGRPLVPDLHYAGHAIADTLAGCDRDGVADAGEQVGLYLTLRNAGGLADSVWARLRLGELEDPSIATVVDSTSLVGDMGVYSTLSGDRHPFRVHINPLAANNRDIVFQYQIGARNSAITEEGTLIVTVQRGEEISGYRPGLTTLVPDRFYIVAANTVVDSLVIHPGVTLRLNPGAGIRVVKHLTCQGTPDSMITFTVNGVGRTGGLACPRGGATEVQYCIFEYFSGVPLGDAAVIRNCIFRYGYQDYILSGSSQVSRCLFHSNSNGSIVYDLAVNAFNDNVVVGNVLLNQGAVKAPASTLSTYRGNIVYGNGNAAAPGPASAFYANYQPFGFSIWHLGPNYLGTTDSASVERLIYDYFEGPWLDMVVGDSALAVPSREAHGAVWKVEVNGVDPQDAHLDPIGAGRARFDVYFNRPMDTSSIPLVTFGAREPFTQNTVKHAAAWSLDSTVWSGTYDVGVETGDGMNTVRVAGARDNEHFEAPTESTRFRFAIQAAGSASNEFSATAGVGKVRLEWPGAPTDDALGYNVYRATALTDSTFTDPAMVNSTLVVDTTYTDFAVTPNTTYLYTYRIVGTDMAESDPSKSVVATPVGAASGDANGDMAVNVLDIVAVVNYVLEERPEPFLAEAADANQDGRIDVLDVVRIVRTILGLPKVADTSPVAATGELTLEDGSIVLRSTVSVAGLQFSLTGPQMADVRLTPTEALRGMETGSATRDGQATYVVYSLSRTVLPTGSVALFRVEGAPTLKVRDVVLSDVDGRTIPTAVTDDESAALPTSYGLEQNYPNPLNPETTIRFALPEATDLRLTVCNLLGQEIRVLRRGRVDAGHYRVVWDGRDDRGRAVASGVYLYRLDAGPYTATRKLVVLK